MMPNNKSSEGGKIYFPYTKSKDAYAPNPAPVLEKLKNITTGVTIAAAQALTWDADVSLYYYDISTNASAAAGDYIGKAKTTDTTADTQVVWSVRYFGQGGQDYLDASINSASTNITALVGKFSGMTSLPKWLRGIFRKDAMDAVAKSEINTGGGAFSEATDSVEALHDAALTTDNLPAAPDNASIGTILTQVNKLTFTGTKVNAEAAVDTTGLATSAQQVTLAALIAAVKAHTDLIGAGQVMTVTSNPVSTGPTIQQLAGRAGVLYDRLRDDALAQELILEAWQAFTELCPGIYTSTAQIALEVGNPYYMLPLNFSTVHADGVKLVIDGEIDSRLAFENVDVLMRQADWTDETGAPARYAFVNARQIALSPVPDAADTLLIVYNASASDTLAFDAPLPITARFQRGLIGYAIAQLAETLGETERAAIERNRFKGAVADWQAALPAQIGVATSISPWFASTDHRSVES
jgi:hypothetical protein